ncbi:protein TonB [Winogradskyella pacifica]|uniref:Protein TonB n=1 Tax=Winogradskyella pacifica TaxID=664642 RepID=A0A3D9MCR1_9FLAO|nr:energy transducer TonB [Winogradskyella pacifica]REE16807.1 protein TonB [Winogradskyella pacifica]
MKNSKNDFGVAGQSATEAKKPQKHDANLQKNSSLYFQIGLILCLLGTYALFEMQFQDKVISIDTLNDNELAVIDVMPSVMPEVIQPEKTEPVVDRSTNLIDEYEEVDNDKDVAESKIITPEKIKPKTKPFVPSSLPDTEDPEDDDIFVPFTLIEKVPVYPGCEKYTNNNDRKKCMSDKITKLIGKKFNVDVGSQYGISGRQKIATQFTIDKFGNVTDIKIRGPHPALEKEANRVINKIPKMEPGLQRQVPVGVIYTLPIIFDSRNY